MLGVLLIRVLNGKKLSSLKNFFHFRKGIWIGKRNDFEREIMFQEFFFALSRFFLTG